MTNRDWIDNLQFFILIIDPHDLQLKNFSWLRALFFALNGNVMPMIFVIGISTMIVVFGIFTMFVVFEVSSGFNLENRDALYLLLSQNDQFYMTVSFSESSVYKFGLRKLRLKLKATNFAFNLV